MTVLDLLRRDGASPAAVAHIGDKESSALHAVWQAAILKNSGGSFCARQLPPQGRDPDDD
jgi:hypothetical protein